MYYRGRRGAGDYVQPLRYTCPPYRKGARVLLANPRWEKRFVRFLELSDVDRTVEEGTDEDNACAARMGEWVVWEAAEERALRGEG